jgi:voltage-gated potassium channel
MASPVAGSLNRASPDDPVVGRRRVRGRILGSVFRVGLTTGALLAVYASAPIGQRFTGRIAVQLCAALLVLGVVVGWQLRSVSRSPYPTLRGVEAVAVSVPLLVLAFATAYLGTDFADPAGFTERLSRIDAVYFAVTVFTTVGFGDIAPRSETARLLVTLQMVVDLVMVGLIAKVLVGAVRQRRNALGRSQP